MGSAPAGSISAFPHVGEDILDFIIAAAADQQSLHAWQRVSLASYLAATRLLYSRPVTLATCRGFESFLYIAPNDPATPANRCLSKLDLLRKTTALRVRTTKPLRRSAASKEVETQPGILLPSLRKLKVTRTRPSQAIRRWLARPLARALATSFDFGRLEVLELVDEVNFGSDIYLDSLQTLPLDQSDFFDLLLRSRRPTDPYTRLQTCRLSSSLAPKLSALPEEPLSIQIVVSSSYGGLIDGSRMINDVLCPLVRRERHGPTAQLTVFGTGTLGQLQSDYTSAYVETWPMWPLEIQGNEAACQRAFLAWAIDIPKGERTVGGKRISPEKLAILSFKEMRNLDDLMPAYC